ncbi:MAG: ABC transporter permease subunit [Planctomycetaceae bacterium]|nr:ABC transporter permease subunit [Planctomycetaceae bacterium]
MNRILLKRYLQDAKWLWLSCALILFIYCWLRVWMVTLFDMSRFEKVLEQFKHLEKFSSVPFAELATYTGRIAIAFDEPIVITSIVIWAVARASDSISGELGRGTMELLLAQPVSRTRLFWSHAGMTVLGLGLLALVTFLGTWLGIATCQVTETLPTETIQLPLLDIEVPNPLAKSKEVLRPMSELVSIWHFLPAVTNLFCLGFFLAGLTCLVSCQDRYRWRTIGIVIGFYVVQLIFKIAGMATEDLGWLLHFTFFTAYEPKVFVNAALRSPELLSDLFQFNDDGQYVRPGALGSHLLLLVLGSCCFFTATVIFRRRDLPAPI